MASLARPHLQEFLTAQDLDDILRAWQPRGANAFASVVRQSGLTEDEQRRLVNEFTDVANSRSSGFDARLSELLRYIPNLRDMENRT